MPYNLNNILPKPTWSTVGKTDGTSAAVAGQRLTATSASSVMFSTFNERTDAVVLDVQTGNVYCTFDGTTPSATNGHILYATNAYTWSRAAASQAKFIGTTGTAYVYASEFQT